jgi:hypothetical protein
MSPGARGNCLSPDAGLANLLTVREAGRRGRVWLSGIKRRPANAGASARQSGTKASEIVVAPSPNTAESAVVALPERAHRDIGDRKSERDRRQIGPQRCAKSDVRPAERD